MKRRFSSLLAAGTFLTAFAVTPALADARTGHVAQTGAALAQIETPEQAVAFANVQNLAARWNTIITSASTGEDQSKLMRESGVFSDDFTIAFVLPDGMRIAFDGLDTDEARSFYNQTINGLKKARANMASNVEVTAFDAEEVRARFRYVVFMGERYSLGGINEIAVQKRGGRYQIVRSEIFVERFDTEHAF